MTAMSGKSKHIFMKFTQLRDSLKSSAKCVVDECKQAASYSLSFLIPKDNEHIEGFLPSAHIQKEVQICDEHCSQWEKLKEKIYSKIIDNSDLKNK